MEQAANHVSVHCANKDKNQESLTPQPTCPGQ